MNTNFTEIQKLPSKLHHLQALKCPLTLAEYATFGHFSQAATDAAVADLVEVSNVVTGLIRIWLTSLG